MLRIGAHDATKWSAGSPFADRVQLVPSSCVRQTQRAEIVLAVVVDRDVGRAGVGADGSTVLTMAQAGRSLRRHVVPGLAAVARHPHQAVVGADPDLVVVARRRPISQITP